MEVNEKLNIIKGMIESKKYHLESLEGEIRREQHSINEYMVKDDKTYSWNWISNSARNIQRTVAEIQVILKEIETLESTTKFLLDVEEV